MSGIPALEKIASTFVVVGEMVACNVSTTGFPPVEKEYSEGGIFVFESAHDTVLVTSTTLPSLVVAHAV